VSVLKSFNRIVICHIFFKEETILICSYFVLDILLRIVIKYLKLLLLIFGLNIISSLPMNKLCILERVRIIITTCV